ncbi:MAG TPA: hypothetical protein VMD29_00705 [Terracidiphilus sp.]|nr:hypothetical protein [Terracidiphilus sp.]
MKIRSILSLVVAMAIAFAGGAITMAQVHDWHDVDKVHHEVIDAINHLDRLRSKNGFNMGGHGEQAKEHLVAAERELDAAVQYLQNH